MIKAIYLTPKRRSAQIQKNEVMLQSGRGIVGDRNFGKDDYPGQNITFIEQEMIDAYNLEHKQSIELSATRRNIITKGVRLNALVGKTFYVGAVMFVGVELCEPCKLLGCDLSNESITSADVVKAFVGKGGLRADVISDGIIAVGMLFNQQTNNKTFGT